ncbi:MAG: RHS repeat-associated core domain-containing protein [Lentisphaerales bacterium]|nr:RHS repeat-associated core domain-containing protein [Lentisphaerales bacterium]
MKDGQQKLIRKYTWGLDPAGTRQEVGGIGALVGMESFDENGESNKFHMVSDAGGNVVNVLHSKDDGTLGVANSYEYGPFGQVIAKSEAVENPYQFNTKYTDEETGLVYYGFRYYDAVHGRWLNRDPMGLIGGINPYVSVSNNMANGFTGGRRNLAGNENHVLFAYESYLVDPQGGMIDGIIKKIRNTPLETLPKSQIDLYKWQVRIIKFGNPTVKFLMKSILRVELHKHASNKLSKRLFDHYLDNWFGSGYELTIAEMKTVNGNNNRNGNIDIRYDHIDTRSRGNGVSFEWKRWLQVAKDNVGKKINYSGTSSWVTSTNAISSYYVDYEGKICSAGGDKWTWEGTVNFRDDFDFDPIWGWTSANTQRSRAGEFNTRVGYILELGNDYKITSVKTNAILKNGDKKIKILGKSSN